MNGLVLVHLLVDFAEVLVVASGLPAFIVITTVDFAYLWLVLAEVQALHGEHLRPNRELEIFVGNFVVAVKVKLREDLIELLFGYVHAPEFEVKFELFSADLPRFFYI